MAAFMLALAISATLLPSIGAPSSIEASTPATQEKVFAQVWVNGIDTGLVVEFSGQSDNLLASGDDLQALGIDAAAGAALIPLRGIPDLTYRLDQATQTVHIHVAATRMRRAMIKGQTVAAEDVLPTWGGLLNYAIYGDDRGNGGVTGELRLFGPAGVLSTGFLARRGLGARGMSVRRLETRYVLENPRTARRLTVGDFVSPDGSADGAIRAGGIQLSTDFTLQPDLVTAPMPDIAGGDGVPSTVDLYVNGVRRLSEDVQSGRFAVSNVPMVDGAGKVSLLVRDVLGHETVQQISFYGSQQLLRRGLNASSVQAGLLRSNAFSRGDRYGAAFASGTMRRGLNNRTTGEARIALANAVQVAGAAMTTKLSEFGIASISGDISHSTHRAGGQIGASFRRDDHRMSIFAVAQKSFGGFETLASQGISQKGWRLQAGGSWQSVVTGGFSLSATMLHADRVTTRILAATWSRPVGTRFSAFANVVGTRTRQSGLLATVGITVVLSPRSTAIVQASRDERGMAGSASWSRFGEADRGTDLRTSVATAPGRRSSVIGGATMRGELGEVGADIQLEGRRAAARAFASGAAIWMGGRPVLTANVGQSFALVQVGKPDVAVTLENRPAGRTRKNGNLLIPNLPANAAARIALDYDAIDLDHDTARADRIVRIRRAGGAIVRIPLRPVRAATIHIVSKQGMPMPLGSIVRQLDGREDVVGYDGVAYLTDIPDEVSAEVQNGDERCHINFFRNTSDPVVCKPI